MGTSYSAESEKGSRLYKVSRIKSSDTAVTNAFSTSGENAGKCFATYIVQCTLYSVYCTLYSVHCTVYTVHCTVYTVHCTVYIVQCTLYIVQCTLYSVYCTLYSVHCAVLTKMLGHSFCVNREITKTNNY